MQFKWQEKRFNFASNHIEMYMTINPKNDLMPNLAMYRSYTETVIYPYDNICRSSFFCPNFDAYSS